MLAEHAILKPARTIRLRFMPHRHTTLLVAIVALLALRPLLGDAREAGPALFSIAILVVMLVALYNINIDDLIGERGQLLAQGRRRRIIGWVLGAAATVERLAAIFAPSHSLYVAGSISWFLFFSFVTWSELRGVLKQREVTGEVISMSISVYLLLGLTWGLLYIVIFQLHPGAFSFGGTALVTPAQLSNPQPIFPILEYFSLTTLSTIGFGDITPVTLQARYAAVAEGITGQFYLAILVARLVGMQMSQAVTQHSEVENKTP